MILVFLVVNLVLVSMWIGSVVKQVLFFLLLVVVYVYSESSGGEVRG